MSTNHENQTGVRVHRRLNDRFVRVLLAALPVVLAFFGQLISAFNSRAHADLKKTQAELTRLSQLTPDKVDDFVETRVFAQSVADAEAQERLDRVHAQVESLLKSLAVVGGLITFFGTLACAVVTIVSRIDDDEGEEHRGSAAARLFGERSTYEPLELSISDVFAGLCIIVYVLMSAATIVVFWVLALA